MDYITIIVGLTVFLLLFFFILIIIMTSGVVAGNSPNAKQPNTISGQFLSSCNNDPCNEGLVCDGTDFLCKFEEGLPCTNKFQCSNDLFCSGLCVSGPVGFLDEFCPCFDAFRCQTQSSGVKICKKAPGTSCISNDECFSFSCVNNICTAGSTNGLLCTDNEDCSSNNCSLGFCQPDGITTGKTGAYCTGDCVNITGAECDNLECICSFGVNQPGICASTDQGILTPCSPSYQCSNNLICTNTQGTICGVDDECNCLFPYSSPNISSTCINGMTSNNNMCLNNNFIVCNSDSQCNSNNCSNNSRVNYYSFNGDIQFPTNFLNSTETTINDGFPGPPDVNISPKKLFVTSRGEIDTLYLVDDLTGFWSIMFDPINNIIVSSWSLLIAHNSDRGTLIDVAYNEINYIAAFLDNNNYILYFGPTIDNLQIFNSTIGPPGVQFDTNNNPLSIESIDISPSNDESSGNDILIYTDKRVYVKRSTVAKYNIAVIYGGSRQGNLLINVDQPARFYFQNLDLNKIGFAVFSYDNISFIDSYQLETESASTILLDRVLQFSGGVAGYVVPIDKFNNVNYEVLDYDIFSPRGDGMLRSSIITLNQAKDRDGNILGIFIILNYSSSTMPIPLQAGDNYKVAVSRHSYYIISSSSCV